MRYSDIKNVNWFETIKLLLARGFFSSLVVLLILFSNQVPGQLPPTLTSILSFIGMWTVGGSFFVLGMWLGVRIMMFMGLGGLALIAMAIPYWLAAVAFALGDPIVWLITKAAPGVFRVAKFRPFNLSPFIIVRQDLAVPEDSSSMDIALPRWWTRGGEID
jgi:hypothetical protein